MNRMNLAVRSVVLLLAFAFLSACSESTEPTPGPTGQSNIEPEKDLGDNRVRPEIVGENPVGNLQTTFDVTYHDDVVIVPPGSVSVLERDKTSGAYYLPDTTTAIADLARGDVVIFTGAGFGRVTGISTVGDEIEIRTVPALLTDVIKDGEVSWEFRPDFDKSAPPTITHNGQPASAGKFAYNPAVTIEASLSKFNFSLEVGCSNPDELSMKVTGSDPSGLTEFSVTGTVSEFIGKGEFRIIDSELQSFSYLVRDVDAAITTEMTVGNEPIVLETGYLPVTLYRFPFLLGPLPMQLKFPLGFAAAMQIPIGGKVNAKSKTTYNVDIGYIFEPPTTIDPIFIDKGSSQTEEEVEYVPNAAGFADYAIAFPRVEWSFLGLDETAAYYVHLAYRLRGNYSQNDLAGNTCREAFRTFAGVGGFFADLFGLAEGEHFVQMFAIDDKFFSEGCD